MNILRTTIPTRRKMTMTTKAPTALLLQALLLVLPGSCLPRFISGTTATRKTWDESQWFPFSIDVFCPALKLPYCFLFLVTFADLLGVPDGWPDHYSRYGFVGDMRGFDILISAPEIRKEFSWFRLLLTYINGSIEEFLEYGAFLLKTKKAPSPGVSVQLPASCCFEKSRK